MFKFAGQCPGEKLLDLLCLLHNIRCTLDGSRAGTPFGLHTYAKQGKSISRGK